MRTVLIVSPHFPPSSVAGVHRARHLAKYLPRSGWRPVIVRANPRHYAEEPDIVLARLVEPGTSEISVEAVDLKLSRKFGIGDLGIRMLPFLGRALVKAIEKEKPDVVFLTGAPFFPLLFSRLVAKRYKIPVVIDLQDPWVSRKGGTAPFFSKTKLLHWMSVIAQPLALKFADAITSVSEVQNSELVQRYPQLSNKVFKAIPIGGDPHDFNALNRLPIKGGNAPAKDSRYFQIYYVGTLLPRAHEVAHTIFTAIKRIKQERPDIASRLKLNFVGTSNQGVETHDYPVTRIAQAAGVDDMIIERPQRVPFVEALSLLGNADALLLFGSDERHYTASKIYPALMSDRPFISLFHAESSSHNILKESKLGYSHCFADREILSRLIDPLYHSFLHIVDNEPTGSNHNIYKNYTAEEVSKHFANLFNEICYKK